MKLMDRIRGSHQWNNHTIVLRVVLAGASLASMILASGAGSYWN